MYPVNSTTAFKEWAVAVRALGQGRQVILLRKGGIREEGKSFQVVHQDFLLYPTYEHQSKEQLKGEVHQELKVVMAEPRSTESVVFDYWAQVHEIIELDDEDKVDALFPYHIWTKDYAQKRLHWRPRSPISMIFLRVYRLEQPVTVLYLSRYGGCRSWVQLELPAPLGNLIPTLSDEKFRQMVGEVKDAIGPIAVKA